MPGETPELKIPFPEEKDEANLGATKITELAEKVDLLLRKQLTKLVEVAKLKVTTTLELPAESFSETWLKKGTLLIKDEGAYVEKSYTKAEMETGIIISSSRPALATFRVESAGTSVGGTIILVLAGMSLWINPGQKIKATVAQTLQYIIL